MIQQIEFVSAYFSYHEEYVLEKTPEWIERKYVQAIREKSEQHKQNVLENFKGIALFLDVLLNKAKGFNDILPKTFDELQQETISNKKESSFIEGQWWSKK